MSKNLSNIARVFKITHVILKNWTQKRITFCNKILNTNHDISLHQVFYIKTPVCNIYLTYCAKIHNLTLVHKYGRYGILIFSCLLFFLFEKICNIKTWWFCLIPIIVLHYGCFGDFFPKIICNQQVVEMGCFTIQKKFQTLNLLL